MPDPHDRWLDSLLAMTMTPEQASKYLDGRLEFTTLIAQQLTLGAGREPQVVYGVWLEAHNEPVYIGQTTDGPRRMWDLPIGESHHLSNSFPPEIWGRIVVVHWGDLLRRHQAEFTHIIEHLEDGGFTEPAKQLEAIGLGLEHLLQSRDRPLMNRRTKRRDGTWRNVSWSGSGSRGARAAPHLGALFNRVDAVWQALCTNSPSPDGATQIVDGGVAVYPSLLRRRHSA